MLIVVRLPCSNPVVAVMWFAFVLTMHNPQTLSSHLARLAQVGEEEPQRGREVASDPWRRRNRGNRRRTCFLFEGGSQVPRSTSAAYRLGSAGIASLDSPKTSH
jgi:hypothetical protein